VKRSLRQFDRLLRQYEEQLLVEEDAAIARERPS